MQGSAELAQHQPGTVDIGPDEPAVPFWITACVRLLPPRRRTGAEIIASTANAVFPIVQALIADQLGAADEAAAPLNRDWLARRCGLGAKKIVWLFDYLKLIGFLRTHRRYVTGHRGRSCDTFTIFATPPRNYVVPRTSLELDHALKNAARGHLPVLFADEGADPSLSMFVYVIGSPGTTTVKIGVTRDVEGRVRQLQNSSPVPLELLWRARGSYALEQRLHAQFDSHRTHGEWFNFGGQSDPVARIKLAALRFGAVEVAA